jgi:hypothetical protein
MVAGPTTVEDAMQEVEEIVQTIDRLQGAFEDLVLRGLRSSGPEHLHILKSLREEFERIGAGHLAGRIASVIDAIQRDERTAASALFQAMASLRVFERVLTLEFAGASLSQALQQEAGED